MSALDHQLDLWAQIPWVKLDTTAKRLLLADATGSGITPLDFARKHGAHVRRVITITEEEGFPELVEVLHSMRMLEKRCREVERDLAWLKRQR